MAYREAHELRVGCSRPRLMNSTVRLGRIGGVEIGAHWSWLLVFALIVWSLASGVFPETNPGLSDGAYLAMAIVAAVLFFASLLLHELGHAMQARRDGVAIGGITLWVFGGVAQLRGQPRSPGAELRIALAGPAVSLALGAIFLLVALALPLPSRVDGVLFWLGQINLYLLVFNLLPALPLDGGRVLHALLWRSRNDYLSATRTAGALGRRFGQLLIAGGLLLVIFVGDFGGVWLAFIGWFLVGAAEAELQSAEARGALAGLTVRDAMIRGPVTVDAAASVQELMDEVFVPKRHTTYPVMNDGEPVGIVSFRRAMELPRAAWASTRVRDIMVGSRDVSTSPDAPLEEALTRLAGGDLGRLLVCRDGHLEGLLSLTDVTRLLEVRRRGARGRRGSESAAPAGEERASPGYRLGTR
jgi:Zn-dependent protease/CBS domain-containing protein